MASTALKIVSSFENLVFSVKAWVKKNPSEAVLLFLILLVGAFMRLYRIDEYMTFLGDEGRDMIVVRRLLVNFDPILIGPGTSIGMMYLGPLYYYMMAPAVLLANFSPVGPVVQIALLGTATIFFVWYVCRQWFPDTIYTVQSWKLKRVNFLALSIAFLYAVSPTTIVFSRSSWNPNIMPFFALLTIWSVWKIWKERKYKWLIVLGISYAFVLNSHYLGLLLLPVILIYWAVGYREARKEKKSKFYREAASSAYIRYSVFSALIFAALMSPLVIFDARHEWRNFRAMQQFVTHRESSFKGLPEAIGNTFEVYLNMYVRLPGGRDVTAGQMLLVLTTVLLGVYFFKKEIRGKIDPGLKIVKLWILFGVLGLAFVEREIYDHYMGFLFPAPYFLIAGILANTEDLILKTKVKKNIVNSIQFLVLGLLVIPNIFNSPLKDNPPGQLKRSIDVSKKVYDEARGQKFNFAVLAESNYEDGYKYWLEVWGANVRHADIWDKSTISDTLFVICEKPKDECRPNYDSKAEVANFGASKIDFEWEVSGVTIYRLSHNELIK